MEAVLPRVLFWLGVGFLVANIRLLVQLSRLMDAHSLDELNDVRSPPHAALMSILRRMATPAHPG